MSADESDTSVEEDAVKKSKETGMPELVDEEFSDTSSVEEVCVCRNILLL